MANSIVKLTVEDSSFNAKIKQAAKTFADFGSKVASAGVDAFGAFTKGAKSAKVAFEGFNAALKSNALVLVASLAAEAGQAIGNFISNWITGAEDAARVQDVLNQKLEETKRLLDEMKYFDNFQMQIDKASGMATTDILQRQFERAQARFERAKRLYTLQIPGTQAYTDAEQMMEQANADMVNAQRALQLDAIRKANGTGEYAKRGGRGRNRKTGKIISPISMAASDEYAPPVGLLGGIPDLALSIISPLEQMNAEMKRLEEARQKAFSTDGILIFDAAIATLQERMDKFVGKMPKIAEETGESFSDAAQAIGSVGSALQQLEDPGAKIAGIIGQAIANIALGFAQATAAASGGGPFAWIAAIAGGLGTMVSTIEAIHSATGYAQGGIINGNSYSGDNIPIMANAGEIVLTKAMANNLASSLQGTGLQNLRLSATVSGTQLRFVLNNESQMRGRGQYVTTNFNG